MLSYRESESGAWKISHFTVDAHDSNLTYLRAIFNHGRGGVPEGTYTRLTRNGQTVMSDTPDEIRDHFMPIARAYGHVLINGLGLGIVLAGVLRKQSVSRVTVIEISQDVIKLVAPYFSDSRLEIVHADAHQYRPPRGARYGAVWHDIWDTICADNIPDMDRLHRKYRHRADYQGSWCRKECMGMGSR